MHPPTHPNPGLRPRLWLSVAIVASLILAACSGPPSVENEGGGRTTQPGAGEGGGVELPDCPLDALEAADGPVTIDIWHGIAGSPLAAFQGIVDDFNASQDRVVVQENTQGDSYQEVMRKYQETSSTPAQLPQIIFLEDTTLGEMVDTGQVLPAQACMDADPDFDIRDIAPQARAAGSVDGVLYPGYMNVSTPILYYNKVHFEAAGLDPHDPPGTLEEVREAAEAIKAAGVAENPLSFVANRWLIETWLSGIGQEVVNNGNGRLADATEATFNTPEALELLEFLHAMSDDGLMRPFARTEGAVNQYLALLPQGDQPARSSMLLETSTAASTIRDFLGGGLSPDEVNAYGGEGVDLGDLDIIPGAGPFPGIEEPGRVFASGGNFFILNTSSPELQVASWEFLKFMLQPENAYRWHTEGGYLPVVKDVLDHSEIEEFWETDLAGAVLKYAVDQLYDSDPEFSGPLIGPYVDFVDITEGALNNILLEGNSPEAEWDRAESRVNDLLERYNGE